MNLLKSIFSYIISLFKTENLLDYKVNPLKEDKLKTTPVTENKPTKIEILANAIAKWEGDTQGTNPGNIKFSSLTQSWGAKKGRKATDGGYFAIFNSKEQGFIALCNFLTLGCKDQLKYFHKPEDRLLGGFLKKFAGNPDIKYIKGIAKEVGCSLETNMKDFL